MPSPSDALKRLVLGRAFSSERIARERLPKALALPTFASDAWSSLAYAPDEILLTLALAGIAAYAVGPWIGLAVAGLMILVVLTTINTVHEYPSGGGDYEVVHRNLGGRAGRVVGSALMVDYMLTVSVSISQAANYLSSALPVLHGTEMWLAMGLIVLVAVVNLRGTHQTGALLAVPVYLFVGLIALLLVIGAIEAVTGTLGAAPSADLEIVPAPELAHGLTMLGAALLVLRAFSSGCVALTGVEAVGNGVPLFRPPKTRNAVIVLLVLGLTSAALMAGVILLASATGVRFVEDPSTQLARGGTPVEGYQQLPVIGQLAQAVSSATSPLFYLIAVVTGIVLFLAANTAFNGFPNLTSVLARDGYLPRRLRVRGDRLVYSNGILALAAASIVLVWVTRAQVTLQIQMYIVGVFVALGLSQLGMMRHFGARLRLETRARARRILGLRRAITVLGLFIIAAVLVVVVATKFSHGAWAALLVMACAWTLMTLVHRHYRAVHAELAIDPGTGDPAARPSRSHAVVLVSTLDRPTLRALSVASATRPSTLEAVTVHDDDGDTPGLVRRWRELDLQFPLRILYSPYRDPGGPVVEHVMTLLTRNPRDVVIVYLPEFQVRHWWQGFLHNHSARRLGARLSHVPRVVVSTVPWQLGKAQEIVPARDPGRRVSAPGRVHERRG